MMKYKMEQGFTIIEAMLAMTFLSAIMVFTVVIFGQLIDTYARGQALIQINQTVRELNDDLARGLQYAKPSSFQQKKYDEEGGAICSDGKAYVWMIGGSQTDYLSNNIQAHMVRINDNTGEYCRKQSFADVKNSLTGINTSTENNAILLGTQASILNANVIVPTSQDPELVKLKFIITTAGNDYMAKKDENSNDYTCFNTKHQTACAFGEFNATIYMRGV